MSYDDILYEIDDGIATMVTVLLKNAGYDVVREGTGTEAWEAISAAPPDLVILDWDMPGMTGLEVLQKMRESGNTAEVAAMFLTAQREEWDPKMATLYNISAYLVKPFEPDELLRLVKEIRMQRYRRLVYVKLFDKNVLYP